MIVYIQLASQMVTLVKLFPLMTGNLMDKEDEHWKCFLLLWDICSIVLAYEVSPNDPVRLAWLVETYLEAFTNTYTQDASLRPLSPANAIVSVP